jgi:FemAB-related protein (PEP-CTERM system-associated)
MSATGRPEREYRSAQREGPSMSATGRPEREYRSAQREGIPMNAPDNALSVRPATAMPLRVRAFGAVDRARWEEFVHRCPDATFFHRIGWKDIIEDSFGFNTHYLLAERGTQIVGILPLAEVKSLLFGHALVSLPFCTYAGVASLETEALAALHAFAQQLGEKIGVEHLELRNRAVREADWPQQDLYVTFRKPILPKVDDNLAAIPRKQRAMVRKGIGHGLMSQIDAEPDRFFALYADNVHRHGTPPLAKRYFEALLRTFGRDCEVLTVTDLHGKAVSSVLSFYFRDEVLPYYAGDVEAARDLAANDFKYWEVLRRACERGLCVFDLGRSKRGTGAFAFKKNWGLEARPLAYEYFLYRRERIPEHNPLNPKYRMLMALWRRLPIPVANLVGPHLVKGLG